MAEILDVVDLDALRKEVREKVDTDDIQVRQHERSERRILTQFGANRSHDVQNAVGIFAELDEHFENVECEAVREVRERLDRAVRENVQSAIFPAQHSGPQVDLLNESSCAVDHGHVVDPDLVFDQKEKAAKHILDEDGWADLVISNGVINLCPDKIGVYRQIYRVLRPGGRMTVADICLERPVPEEALHDIDLWTG